ncbi:hypothetical protein Rumeso_04600 [Rubellimicrobium mesophilum DSM 19309]|uniref:DUF4178 domain-containing protein n=1 Tax=Rubellimicrobium mesophilum DSM 19309 TaxID=442562 RepID=A0A017HHR6_9RHOB|nr:DUF4178 domain-containing protein [Rubellimicrobium mesophilum]EYD73865.1 hypothetical protein Rumeso_04600 [Rubellimicrobium mesophilum DSM 19309]
MTRQPELRSIDCPNCGAGLEILGGGRVTTHVCGYCGSALDALENYKVLARFANMQRPFTPLSIGMEGKLGGVPFRVIGILEEEERDDEGTWRWVDHVLYSPTHGYAWLTLEDGELTWTRRFRKAVSPSWVDPSRAAAEERAAPVSVGGERFNFDEAYASRIIFVEGEFTWRPAVGDTSRTVSFKRGTRGVHFVETPTEREVETSERLPHGPTLKAFGVKDASDDLRPGTTRDDPGDDGPYMIWVSGLCGAACLIGGLALSGMSHTILPATTFTPAELPAEVEIPVDGPGLLTRIDLEGQVQSGWAWIELDLTDPEDQPVFIAGREVGYYTGRDSDGSWTENDRSTTVTFRPETAGAYTLAIAVDEAGLGEGDTPGGPIPSVTVSASAGHRRPFWLFLAGAILATVAGWQAYRRHQS